MKTSLLRKRTSRNCSVAQALLGAVRIILVLAMFGFAIWLLTVLRLSAL